MKHASMAAGFLALIASGCGSTVQEQRAEPRRGETVSPVPTPKAPAKITFSKTLERGEFTAEVTSTGEGNRRALALTARRAGREMAVVRDSIAGEITEALLTDLNQNELPEALVFVRETGVNARGQVYGFEFATQEWERFELPTLPPEATTGYQGHDQFTVAGADLVRTFPIYRPADAPMEPTGGKRTIRYALDHTLRLMEVSLEDQP
ncbi:hypothetical protein [Hymenobacter roseosalivarius]|nr:hypothetical protein [Hymenobacter roseosalivarius]